MLPSFVWNRWRWQFQSLLAHNSAYTKLPEYRRKKWSVGEVLHAWRLIKSVFIQGFDRTGLNRIEPDSFTTVNRCSRQKRRNDSLTFSEPDFLGRHLRRSKQRSTAAYVVHTLNGSVCPSQTGRYVKLPPRSLNMLANRWRCTPIGQRVQWHVMTPTNSRQLPLLWKLCSVQYLPKRQEVAEGVRTTVAYWCGENGNSFLVIILIRNTHSLFLFSKEVGL